MCVRGGLAFRGALFFSNEIQEYTVPFMGSDPSVVKRTQRYLMEEYQATPVSILLDSVILYYILFYSILYAKQTVTFRFSMELTQESEALGASLN